MSLADAVIGLKAYKEVDERMAQLWHDLDTTILTPRTDIAAGSLLAVRVEDVSSYFMKTTFVSFLSLC